MKKNIVPLVYIVAITLLFIVIYNNMSIIEENGKGQKNNSYVVNNNTIFQYMEAVEYPIDTCQKLFCYIDSLNDMTMVYKQPRIGLYIDAHQCTSCWKKELKRLSIWDDSLHFENTPIVIANNFNLREIKIMQGETKVPIYSLGNDLNFLLPLTKFNSPFFFVVENGVITRPYFSSEETPISLSQKYLSHIRAILKTKKTLNSLSANNSLIIQNPIIDLGNVKPREKKTIQYRLHNNMNEPCLIYNCTPSCSCVFVDSFSTSISAGEDGYVCVSTSQINKGEFNHSINIQTNIQTQPYSVEFSGYCE